MIYTSSQSHSKNTGKSTTPFPTDIFELIIDCVPICDRRTLMSCAQTCRAWRPRSRYKLFIAVTLDSSKAFEGFLKAITADPALDDIVREVTLCCDHASKNPWHTLAAFPAVFARKLTRIECLKIDGRPPPGSVRQGPSPMFHQSFFLLLQEFKSVARLEIVDTYFDSLNDLGRLVCAIPTLRSLTVKSVSWVKQGSCPLSRYHGFPQHISSIVFDGKCTDALLRWIHTGRGGNRSLALPSLEKLEISDIGVDDLRKVKEILVTIKPSQRHVTVRLGMSLVHAIASSSTLEDILSLGHVSIHITVHPLWLMELLIRYCSLVSLTGMRVYSDRISFHITLECCIIEMTVLEK
ncbi:hypothetical protein B0H21DRAFT_227724 [Amylocystis lapponica]|nr:hypothetical protein B0H21DRAFT_227724 [Amylocystis lapponica]